MLWAVLISLKQPLHPPQATFLGGSYQSLPLYPPQITFLGRPHQSLPLLPPQATFLGGWYQSVSSSSPTTSHIFEGTISVSSPTTGHIFGDTISIHPPAIKRAQIPLNQGAQRPIHLPQHPGFTVIFPLGHPTDAPDAFPKVSPPKTELCCCPTQVIWGATAQLRAFHVPGLEAGSNY